MSYDVTLSQKCDCCKNEEIAFSANHTSNTSEMWREAGCDLTEFHGKKAMDLYPSLDAAIEKIEANPEAYQKYAPPNGWGTVSTTLGFLRKIRRACIEYDEFIVSVDC